MDLGLRSLSAVIGAGRSRETSLSRGGINLEYTYTPATSSVLLGSLGLFLSREGANEVGSGPSLRFLSRHSFDSQGNRSEGETSGRGPPGEAREATRPRRAVSCAVTSGPYGAGDGAKLVSSML